MFRAAIVTRRLVILLAIAAALAACRAPSPPTSSTEPAPTADVSGTVAAQVQATVQALGGTRNGSPATPAPTTRVVPVVNLPIILDERFATPAQGWPDHAAGGAWHAGGVYHLAAREHDRFMALGAPLTGALGDAVVSANFRKVGGSPGGGFGLIVHDQNTNPQDGSAQSGRFIVAEIGDEGTVGIWRREDDRWVDLVPWTPSTTVRAGDTSNELTVQTLGDDITLLANGIQVAQAAMGLPKGGIGVFVGGDGNQIVLERFTVRAGPSGVTDKADSTAPTLSSTPIPVDPARAPAPVQSTTPPMSVTFQLPDIANKDKEIGCGAFCVWYASVDSITRTNDPLVAAQPLGQGEEFVIATITFNAKDERTLPPETDFRLDGGTTALPVGQLRLQGVLTGMLSKGETRTGPVVFKVRAGQPLPTSLGAKTRTRRRLTYATRHIIRVIIIYAGGSGEGNQTVEGDGFRLTVSYRAGCAICGKMHGEGQSPGQ